MMWTIEKIEKHGFKLIANDKQWCHFRGHGFEVHINLDTRVTAGNYFNFKSDKSSYKGHFKAVLINDEEMEFLLSVIR